MALRALTLAVCMLQVCGIRRDDTLTQDADVDTALAVTSAANYLQTNMTIKTTVVETRKGEEEEGDTHPPASMDPSLTNPADQEVVTRTRSGATARPNELGKWLKKMDPKGKTGGMQNGSLRGTVNKKRVRFYKSITQPSPFGGCGFMSGTDNTTKVPCYLELNIDSVTQGKKKDMPKTRHDFTTVALRSNMIRFNKLLKRKESKKEDDQLWEDLQKFRLLRMGFLSEQSAKTLNDGKTEIESFPDMYLSKGLTPGKYYIVHNDFAASFMPKMGEKSKRAPFEETGLLVVPPHGKFIELHIAMKPGTLTVDENGEPALSNTKAQRVLRGSSYINFLKMVNNVNFFASFADPESTLQASTGWNFFSTIRKANTNQRMSKMEDLVKASKFNASKKIKDLALGRDKESFKRLEEIRQGQLKVIYGRWKLAG